MKAQEFSKPRTDPLMRNIGLAGICVTAAILHLDVGLTAEPQSVRVTIQKEIFWRENVTGVIGDVSTCKTTDGERMIVVLTSRECIILNQNKTVQQRHPIEGCVSASLSQIAGEKCLFYCSGDGFGPVYAADLDGNLLWTLSFRSGTIRNAERSPAGNFYIGTSEGSKIVDSSGKTIREVTAKLTNIRFFTNAPFLTASQHGLIKRTIEIRNEQLDVIKAFDVKAYVMDFVMFDWPKPGNICYVTDSELICMDGNGKTIKAIPLGNGVRRARGVIVTGKSGRKYLAFLATYETAKHVAKVVLISPELRQEYEEIVPFSRSLTSLEGTAGNDFLVGVGSTGIDRYMVEEK